jgi:hypothetical protein
MLMKGLVPFALVSAVGCPASAEVKSATPTGFEVVTTAAISAPVDRVYAALGEVGRWVEPLAHLLARCRQPQH